ncbi:MAG: Trx7/PDZ domain-containing (seleno)protein [Pirellulaceae bacterium]
MSKPMLGLLVAVCWGGITVAQDRETKVRGDRTKIESQRYWIYNDLDSGLELARQTRKPALVVLRCIPCEHCAQLDERVVEQDPVVQSLLDQFLCIRIVHANGLDLSLFQYDYDQSWAAFFLNADRTIYGRYGTRSHQTESDDDVSLEGFAEALRGALELHRQFPAVKAQLAAKQGPPSKVKVPEEFPSLKGKYGSKLNYDGKVVQSCIHCHQVGEAWRLVARDTGETGADRVLYPYPHPKSLGFIMNPKERARVDSIVPGSLAEQSGFLAGDDLLVMQGQPLLSLADIQWVLHHTGSAGTVPVAIRRKGQEQNLELRLPSGWRQLGDISWRATSWDLRRMVTGGLLFEEIPTEERSQSGLTGAMPGLRIKHVGQYGAHAAGKRAGFLKDDVLIEVEGQAAPPTESLLLTQLFRSKRPGESVAMTVLRGGKRVSLQLPIQ